VFLFLQILLPTFQGKKLATKGIAKRTKKCAMLEIFLFSLHRLFFLQKKNFSVKLNEKAIIHQIVFICIILWRAKEKSM
jgi:hypothetical protein